MFKVCVEDVEIVDDTPNDFDNFTLAVPEPVLCYVDGQWSTQWATFTTQPLEDIQADDYNDAPYEHNCGQIYEWRPNTRGIAPYTLTTVLFTGQFLTPAQVANSNSHYSAEMINKGMVPWLVSDPESKTPGKPIMAGTILSEFKRLIRLGGGTVWMPDLS